MVRAVVLLNAVGLNLWWRENFERPGLGLLLLVVMIAWTGFAIRVYHDRARRRVPLLLVDLR